MIIRLFVLLTIVPGCSLGYAEEAVEIPLSDIWAYRMPGTKGYADLDQDQVAKLSRLQARLTANRHQTGKGGTPLPPGFAVSGDDVITQVIDILNGKKGETVLNGKITLIFYTALTGRYVHLDNVQRDGNVFTINYHLVFHNSQDLSSHFAFIPVGELEPGKYEVKINRGTSIGDKNPLMSLVRPLKPGEEQATVCGEFSFQVE